MTLVVPLLMATALLLLYGGFTSRHRVARVTHGRRALDRPTARRLAASVAWGSIALLLAAGMTGAGPVAVVVGVGAAFVASAWMRGRETRRRGDLRDEWPDVLATLVSAVRAGISLPEACVQLADGHGTRSRSGFESFVATYRASGSFSAGLERLRSEMADPIADRVVISLQAAHELGGTELVTVLQALADFVQEDLRVRKEIEARWSWNVTAARIAAAAPPIVLLLMATRPEGSAAFSTAAGSAVVVAGMLATALGYRIMLWIARLPADERLR